MLILKKTGMIIWLVVEESVMTMASKIIVTLLTQQLLWVKIGEKVVPKKLGPPPLKIF